MKCRTVDVQPSALVALLLGAFNAAVLLLALLLLSGCVVVAPCMERNDVPGKPGAVLTAVRVASSTTVEGTSDEALQIRQ